MWGPAALKISVPFSCAHFKMKKTLQHRVCARLGVEIEVNWAKEWHERSGLLLGWIHNNRPFTTTADARLLLFLVLLLAKTS